jgi:hypothetical protein
MDVAEPPKNQLWLTWRAGSLRGEAQNMVHKRILDAAAAW